jgi:ankyrin repeat protein
MKVYTNKKLLSLTLLTLASISSKTTYTQIDPFAFIPSQYDQQTYNTPYAYSDNTLSAVHEAAFRDDISTTTGLKYFFEVAYMPDTPDAYGHNALWYAVEGDAYNAACYLLDTYPTHYNLLVAGDTATGETYLHRAKSPRMINLLLSRGAPINALDYSNKTPLASLFLQATTTHNSAEKAAKYTIIRALIENNARILDSITGDVPAGAVLTLYDIYGSNPVLVNVLLGNFTAVYDLLEREYQENPTNLLSIALGLNTPKEELQLNKKVYGLSPLFAAIGQNNIALTALLFLYGVDNKIRNFQNKNPYTVAANLGHHEIEAMLQQISGARNDNERRALAGDFLRRYSTVAQ